LKNVLLKLRNATCVDRGLYCVFCNETKYIACYQHLYWTTFNYVCAYYLAALARWPLATRGHAHDRTRRPVCC